MKVDKNLKEKAKNALGPIKSKINQVKSLSDLEIDELIDFAENVVISSLSNIKTHQIRRFFTAVKNIAQKISFGKPEKMQLHMLRPQIANASAKQRGLQEFEKICSNMIKKIDTKEDFDVFTCFFESVVAYHKVYGQD